MPSTRTSPLVGSSKPSMIFSSVVLPPPEGPITVTNDFRPNLQIDIFKHEALCFGIAEAHIA